MNTSPKSNNISELTTDQGRAARAILGWKLEDTALAAGVGTNTVFRFEKGDALSNRTLKDIRRAYEEAGIGFSEAGGTYRAQKEGA